MIRPAVIDRTTFEQHKHLDALLLTCTLSFFFVTGLGLLSPTGLGPVLAPIAILLLGAYWVISLYGDLIFGVGQNHLQERWKWFLLLLLVVTIVVAPTAAAILERQRTSPENYIHDGAIQVEEAGRFFMAGKNPYEEDYTETPMINWPAEAEGPSSSPALFHLVYLPLIFIVSGLADAALRPLLGWYDVRLLFLAALIGSIMLINRVTATFQHRALLLIASVFIPLTLPYLVEGRNDVVISFLMLLTVFFLLRERPLLAAFTLGLSCSVKQTAWFATPYILLYISGEGKPVERIKRVVWPAVVFGLTLGGLALPWAAMNPGAFIEDTFTYLSGRIPTSYPIYGIGFGKLILSIGVAKSAQEYFPFSTFQLGLGLPILLITLWRQWRANTLSNALIYSTLFLFTAGYFTRTFSENYLGYLVGQLFLGFLVKEHPSEQAPSALPGIRWLEFMVIILFTAQQVQSTQWTFLITSILLVYWIITLLVPAWMNTRRRPLVLFGLITLIFALAWSSWIIGLLPSIGSSTQQRGVVALLEGQSPYSGSADALTDLPGNMLLNTGLTLVLRVFGAPNAILAASLMGAIITGGLIGAIGSALAAKTIYRVIVWTGVAISPLLIPYVVIGEPPGLAFAAVLLTVYLLWKRRVIAAGLALGAGCLSYGPVWLLAPLAGAWVFQNERLNRRTWLAAGAFAATVIAGLLPFLAADPNGMLQNTILIPLGIAGLPTTWNNVNSPGLLSLIAPQAPHWLFEIVLIGAGLIILMRQQPSGLRSLLVHYVVLVSAFCLLAPIIPPTLSGFVLFCGIAALIWDAREEAATAIVSLEPAAAESIS